MTPLLRREGRDLEASVVESALAAVGTENPGKPGLFKSRWQTPAFRSGQMVFISGLILVVFTITSALWLICVGLLRAKPDLSRPMNWLASYLGCAPALLSLSCLALFASFFPYSRSIAEYSLSGRL